MAARHTRSFRWPSILGGVGVRTARMCGRGGSTIAPPGTRGDTIAPPGMRGGTIVPPGTRGGAIAWASTSARTGTVVNTDARHCITAAMALVERLAELVSFDTQNPDGEEQPLVHR